MRINQSVHFGAFCQPIAIAVLALCACVTPLPPPAPPVDGAGCEGACATMERLHYPGWDGSPGPDRARGTADDATCAEVCIAAGETSGGLAWDTECIAAARNADEVDACSEVDP